MRLSTLGGFLKTFLPAVSKSQLPIYSPVLLLLRIKVVYPGPITQYPPSDPRRLPPGNSCKTSTSERHPPDHHRRMTMPLARDPLLYIGHPQCPQRSVVNLHPGYRARLNVLLRFFTPDNLTAIVSMRNSSSTPATLSRQIDGMAGSLSPTNRLLYASPSMQPQY